MRYLRILVLALLALGVLIGGPAPLAHAATFTVDSTGDGSDSNPGDGSCDDGSGQCTLRAAIEEANHANNPGLDTIAFSIGSGVQTISPASALPTVTDPVVIDGYSQPGASPNTNPPELGGNAVLKIGLDGSSLGWGVGGLRITAGSSTLRGLVINRFSGGPGGGIVLEGGGGNVIEGNYIGTDVTGTAALGNGTGVSVSSPSNTIGGTTAGARNIISANISTASGVSIVGSDATGNEVQGNFIGTDVTGTAALGNGAGVTIHAAASGNTIGGTAPEARNIISGNGAGVAIGSDMPSTGNMVQGNYIGTDVTGTADVGNTLAGVEIMTGSGNTIGGTTPGAGNVISGNDGAGIEFSASDATGNLVQGNYIGTDVTGTADLGNSNVGVDMFGSNNIVGGTADGAGNVISGNDYHGVLIDGWVAGVNQIQVQGNYIGTDATGTADLGNAGDGVHVWNAPDNTIGGTAAGAGNVISGNDWHGVYIGGGATDNHVQGNYIGTDVTGTADLGNSGNGVYFSWEAAGSGNTIGGTAAWAGNTIAFNGGDGVYSEGGTGNAIHRNSIHFNTGLGIDLAPDGVTPNDTGDGDTGANNLQNFPVLTSAASGSTFIEGTLNSTANTEFTLEFFSNTACDPSGFGEGETFVGSTTVTTDGSGNASFAVSFGTTVAVGQFITATATDADDNTSEFSQCAAVTERDSDGDSIPDSSDNCPAWPNPGQSLPPWPVPADDPDCDGWSTDDENSIGTDPLLACGVDCWPPDITDSQAVDFLDLNAIVPVLFQPASGNERYNLSVDAAIDFLDLNAAVPFLFRFCELP